MSELYRSDTLVVRAVPRPDRTRWVVTFDHYRPLTDFNRRAFGEAFFKKRGISALYVMCAGNHWYQYPDMPEAIAAARGALVRSGANRILTYGTSMGAYAALRHADALGASAVLALSPQYSNDPARVPWELRWQRDWDGIEWQPHSAQPLSFHGVPAVIYDSENADRRHAELIAEETPCDLIDLPYAGHPVGRFLLEAGLLHEIIFAALDGTLDPPKIKRAALAARSRSFNYLVEISKRQPSHRRRIGLSLARRAAAAAPENLRVRSLLADWLSQNGLHAEALPLHEDMVGENRSHERLVRFAEALAGVGDLDRAIEIGREALIQQPHQDELRDWLKEMMQRGERGESLE